MHSILHRLNTNQSGFQTAANTMKEEGKQHTIIRFKGVYTKLKLRAAFKIVANQQPNKPQEIPKDKY